MSTTLRTVANSHLRTQRLRFALTRLGVAIAAFFMCAVLLLNSSITESTRLSIAEMYNQTDAVLQSPTAAEAYRGQGLPLDSAVVEEVKQSPLVDSIWALTTTYDNMQYDRQGVTDYQTVTRFDLPQDVSSFPFELAEGNFPQSADQVLISSLDARDRGLSVGQEVKLSDWEKTTEEMITTAQEYPQRTYVISGIYRLEAPRSQMQGAVFTLGSQSAAYQRLMNTVLGQNPENLAPTVLIKFKDPSTTVVDLTGELDPSNASYQLLNVDDQIQQDVKVNIDGINYLITVLLSFAALALFMAAFIISNTFQVLAQQRGKELALLRVLGAKRGQLARMLLSEAALLGSTSALAGIATSYLVAFVLKVSNEDFYISLAWLPAILALLVCTVITALSALPPALKAYRTAPLQALTTAEEAAPKRSFRTLALGLLALLAGGTLALVGVSTVQPLAIVSSTFLLALGSIILLPLPLVALLKLYGRLLPSHSAGGLAVAGALQSRTQTAATGRMVYTCVALVAALLTGSATVEVTSLKDVESYSPFEISAKVQLDEGKASSLADEISQVAGVNHRALGLPQGQAALDEAPHGLEVYSFNDQDLAALWPSSSTLDLEDGHLLISQTDADSAGLAAGEKVSVTGELGSRDLTVQVTDAAIDFLAVNTVTGQQLSGSSMYSAEPGKSAPHILIASLTPDINRTSQADALSQIAQLTNLDPSQLSGALQAREAILENTRIGFYVAFGILGITLLISLVGIANTQVLSAHQRRRQHALLRSLGLSRKALSAVLTREILAVGLIAVSMGLLVGVSLGLLLLQAFVAEGAVLAYAFAWQGLVATWIGGLTLAWLAASLPAYKAAGVPPVAALRQVT